MSNRSTMCKNICRSYFLNKQGTLCYQNKIMKLNVNER